MSQYRKLNKLNFVVLVILAGITFQVSQAADEDGLLKIYFLDVGQGDAIFIETPNGNQILVDGGPDNKILTELGEIMSFYDNSIDMVVVSHPHADHISGLIEVAQKYEIGAVIEAEEIYDSPQFTAWEQVLSDKNIAQVEALAGKKITLDEDLDLMLLHPFQSVANTKTQSPHNDSVAVLLHYKSFKLFLTGDMEASVERKLLVSNVNLDADVLKVGHHGSNTSTSEEFLKEISPSLAVIQAGKDNKYHHPSIEVISRLESFKIPYYRNDVNGTIKVVSDGTTFAVSKEK